MKYKSISVNRLVSHYILSLKDSWRVILLVSLFICGLIIGSFAVKNNNSLLSSQLEEIIKSAIIKKGEMTFLQSFADSFITNGLFLILIFIFGLCRISWHIHFCCFVNQYTLLNNYCCHP